MAQQTNKRYQGAEELSFLEPEQHRALMRFNTKVLIAGASCSEAVDHARIRALRQLKSQELKELAGAFEAIWPHWFTNGRSELEVQQLCIEIVKKISSGRGPSVVSGLEWLGRMGGMRLTGGRHRVAIYDERGHSDHSNTRGARGMKYCIVHPERSAVSYGLCQSCRDRNNRLRFMRYAPDELPEALWREIMGHAKFKHGKFIETVEPMIKAYERKYDEKYKRAAHG